MSAPSLYTIAQGFADLDGLLDDLESAGAPPEVDALHVAQWLAELDGQLAAKVEDVAKFLRMVELDAKNAHEEAERLRDRAAKKERKALRVKAALMFALDAARLKKLETKTFSLTVAENGGRPAVDLDDVDPNDVAETHPDFVAVVTQINKPAVREALERGAVLPFARLAPRGRHLRIR